MEQHSDDGATLHPVQQRGQKQSTDFSTAEQRLDQIPSVRNLYSQVARQYNGYRRALKWFQNLPIKLEDLKETPKKPFLTTAASAGKPGKN